MVAALLSERNSLFHGMGQQDAHEALMGLLDALHEDLAVHDHAGESSRGRMGGAISLRIVKLSRTRPWGGAAGRRAW